MIKPHIVVIISRYYAEIAELLEQGAKAELAEAGVDATWVEVPGAFEIPAALAMAWQSGRFDGAVVFGCVIRGETSHYDLVCEHCTTGVGQLAVVEHVPLGFGLLTTENEAQALVRAKSKGRESVQACLALLRVQHEFASLSID
jgi:6,7-dimethyl-8-ribityllumazine synthase